jgi:sugar O-acyltransferase (sialic acid O-acetyltransferase NeuD family)
MQELILFPFGGNSREALLIALAQNKSYETFSILGFVDDNITLEGRSCCGVPVLGNRTILSHYHKAYIIATPGRAENYWTRKKVITSLEISTHRYTTLIHPNALVADDATVGFNCVIMSGCFISTNVVIGNHCVVLPNTVISHDTRVGDYTIIGSNVSLSGGLSIGSSCYIGSGTKVIQEVTIGDYVLTGLGTVVTKSVQDNSIVVGAPARMIKTLEQYKLTFSSN